MGDKLDWKKDVFAEAVKVSNEKRRRHPELSVTDSIKLAWADPKVKSLKERYQSQKARQKK